MTQFDEMRAEHQAWSYDWLTDPEYVAIMSSERQGNSPYDDGLDHDAHVFSWFQYNNPY